MLLVSSPVTEQDVIKLNKNQKGLKSTDSQRGKKNNKTFSATGRKNKNKDLCRTPLFVYYWITILLLFFLIELLLGSTRI